MTSIKAVSPIGRVVFSNLAKPRVNKFKNCDEFSITLLFDADQDFSGIEKVMSSAAHEKWGAKAPKKLKPNVKDGDEKDLEKYPFFEGKVYMSFSNTVKAGQDPEKVAPALYAPDMSVIDDPSLIYNGCYARVIFNAYAYEFEKIKKGVSLYLSSVQKAWDADRIEGSGGATDDSAMLSQITPKMQEVAFDD